MDRLHPPPTAFWPHCLYCDDRLVLDPEGFLVHSTDDCEVTDGPNDFYFNTDPN